MEITRITVHQYDIPLHEPFVTALKPIPELERVLVEIETGSGVVGLGEGAPAYEVTGETQRSTAAVIEDVLGPASVGMDPVDIEHVRQKMWSLVDGSPAAHAAMEIALQDIRGKVAGMPVYQLLGSNPTAPKVDAPNVLSVKSPSQMAEDAASAVEKGYQQIKIKVGENPTVDTERVEAIDAAVPGHVSLKADANQGWSSLKTAARAIRGMSDYIDVIEQPVDKDNISDLAELRRRTDIPVMPDESVESPADLVRLVRQSAGDVYNIKLMKAGGLSEAIRIDNIAAADDRPTQIGSMVEGEVGTAAGVHFAIARDNVLWNEMVGPFMTETGITTLETDRPEITVTGPGLGVELHRDVLSTLRTDRTVITE